MFSKINLLKNISCFLFLNDFEYINIVLENCLCPLQFCFVMKCSCLLRMANGFFEYILISNWKNFKIEQKIHKKSVTSEDYFTYTKIEDQICSWSCKALPPPFEKSFICLILIFFVTHFLKFFRSDLKLQKCKSYFKLRL